MITKEVNKISRLGCHGPGLDTVREFGGNHRFSRFDAFVWLIEQIGRGTAKHDN